MSTKPRNKEVKVVQKRKRTVITSEQGSKLEAAYQKETCPGRVRKEQLAQELDITEKFVIVWFQNRRAKQKREEEMAQNVSFTDNQKPKSSDVCSNPSESGPEPNHTPKLDFPDKSSDKHEAEEPCNPGTSSAYSSIDQVIQDVIDQSYNMHDDDDATTAKSSSTEETAIEISSSEKDTPLKSKSLRRKKRKLEKIETISQSTAIDGIESATSHKLKGEESPKIASGSNANKKQLKHILPVPKGTKPCSVDLEDSMKDLLKMTKIINNQMSWGTFGMNKVENGPGYKTAKVPGKNDAKPDDEMATFRQAGTRARFCSDIFCEDDKNTSTDRLSLENLTPGLDSESSSYNFFRSVINMIAVAEGGIIPRGHPNFESGANDVCYGIRLRNSRRLVYTREYGLDIVEDIKCTDVFPPKT